MKRRRLAGGICEQAALYATGALEAAEARAFEEHLGGCPPCESEVAAFRETAALLPLSLPERKPDPALRARLISQIADETPQVWKRWAVPQADEIHVVRGGAGGWQPVVEGVYAKQLYVDPETKYATMLIRMEPGATYPAHRHGGAEQCFVLEGDLENGDLELEAGDYQCAASGSTHEVTRTRAGCLLLIVSSPHDELLAADERG